MQHVAATPAPKATPENELSRYVALTRKHECLIPQAVVCKLMNLSDARVSRLFTSGMIPRYMIWGKPFVGLDVLRAVMAQERVSGRPVGDVNWSEVMRECWDAMSDAA